MSDQASSESRRAGVCNVAYIVADRVVSPVSHETEIVVTPLPGPDNSGENPLWQASCTDFVASGLVVADHVLIYVCVIMPAMI